MRVPAGVEDGARLRIAPPDGDGELFGVVRVTDHPYFTRRGNDIALRLPVTLAEAALGGVLTVPTLTGAVALRLAPGTPHGRTLRVRGRGIPRSPQPGDLLVVVEVVIPTALNDAQRTALEAFAAATESPRKHFESHEANRADGWGAGEGGVGEGGFEPPTSCSQSRCATAAPLPGGGHASPAPAARIPGSAGEERNRQRLARLARRRAVRPTGVRWRPSRSASSTPLAKYTR